jgi:DNA-binding NarL/FixJ family response regulator
MKRVLSVAERADLQTDQLDKARRLVLADWCKMVDARLRGKNLRAAGTDAADDPLVGVHLTPRTREILSCLLGGDSEKQIAGKLGISAHTVHTYVKQLHKTLGVNSRGELLARFVRKA